MTFVIKFLRPNFSAYAVTVINGDKIFWQHPKPADADKLSSNTTSNPFTIHGFFVAATSANKIANAANGMFYLFTL